MEREDDGRGTSDPQPDPPGPDEDLPSLPVRLFHAFLSPGKLGDMLADNPKWVGALLATTLVGALAVALIPVELMVEGQRQAALERGVDFPELSQQAQTAMRIGFPVATMVTTPLFAMLIAGFYALVFAFILGDEGRFKQYLAVVAHAWFIPLLFSLLITPLRVSTGDPQLTLNLAGFMFFLPEGYLLNVFRALDLTQIWSSLVVAQGVHAIDNRRSFGSALPVVLAPLIVLSLFAARFM